MAPPLVLDVGISDAIRVIDANTKALIAGTSQGGNNAFGPTNALCSAAYASMPQLTVVEVDPFVP